MPTSRVVLVVAGVALVAVWMAAAAGACVVGSLPAGASMDVASGAWPPPGGLPVVREPRRPAAVAARRRDPFRLAELRSRQPAAPDPAAGHDLAAPEAAPAIPDGPALSLIGVADSDAGPRRVRTAIVSGAGELWLAVEGQSIAGRYRVVRIQDDRVDLHDALGGGARILRLR